MHTGNHVAVQDIKGRDSTTPGQIHEPTGIYRYSVFLSLLRQKEYARRYNMKTCR